MDYCAVSTPVGRLLLAGDREGLRRISFQNGFHPVEPAPDWRRTEEPFAEVLAQLDAYFAGKLRRFELPLAAQGTPFQREVWSALTTIPLRRYRVLSRARTASQQTARIPGGRGSQRPQPYSDRHPVPPGHRRGRVADRIRRWTGDQAPAAGSGMPKRLTSRRTVRTDLSRTSQTNSRT